LSKQICLENGINNFSDKDDAYTVTTDAYSDHMNLISMELPSDARAKKGHVKKHMGVFFFIIGKKVRRFSVMIVLLSIIQRVIVLLNMFDSTILMVK